MRATMMYAPGDVRVEERPEPTIEKPTDAVISLSASCICGSDLWPYRGADAIDGPLSMGHAKVLRGVYDPGRNLLDHIAVDNSVGDSLLYLEAGKSLDFFVIGPDGVRHHYGANKKRQ